MAWTMTFKGDGSDFSAHRDAEKWLAERGYSVGPMQRGAPIGVMLGDYEISKWRNLTKANRDALHGLLETEYSFREGPVTLTLHTRPEKP